MYRETLTASQHGFTKIQQALKDTQEELNWPINSEEWCYYAAKLNDSSWKDGDALPYGMRTPTWIRFASGYRGEPLPINAKAFKCFCQVLGLKWEDVVEKNTDLPGNDDYLWQLQYDDNTWVGRQDIISLLKAKINNLSRIVILNGITGIGKTALAEKLYLELTQERQWHRLLRVHFDNQEQKSLSNFTAVADRWLQECNILVTPEDRQNVSTLRNRLVEYITEHSCLVIIDSLEWILEGNQEEGWSRFKDQEWGLFFRAFLSQLNCKSRIIITTQHLPEDVSAGYDNFYFCQLIEGLVEFTDQLELFAKIGVTINAEKEKEYLLRVGNVYSGHTLTLKTIAGIIKTQYQGNMTAYWKNEGETEIEKVENDLKSSKESMTNDWRLHNSNRDLYFKVYRRFDQAFERLKQYNYYSYLLLCFTSSYLRPHSQEDLLEHLKDEECSKEERDIALSILIEEQLIETVIQENARLFKLHNLIRSVAYEHYQKLD